MWAAAVFWEYGYNILCILLFFSGTHCSTSPPRDLVTAGDTLTISFSSNDKIVDAGFSAEWKAVDPADIESE